MRNTIKQYLIVASTFFIIFYSLVSLSTILLAYRTIHETQEIFLHLTKTTVISQKLSETHQNIRKIVLYQHFEALDFKKEFEKSAESLISLTNSTAPLIKEVSEQMQYINIYYNYISIQNMIHSYVDMAFAIEARYEEGEEQVVLLDSLYHLKGTQSNINEKISALLQQQQIFLNEKLTAISNTQRKNLFIATTIYFFLYFAAFFAIFRLVKSISTPIHKLAEASENIQNGKFDTIQLKRSKIADFNVLIKNFNAMSKRISESIKELKEKASLEEKLRKVETKNLQIENSLSTAQIQVMQNQINPHFLFNTLNILSSLSRIEKAQKTKHLIDDLSKIIRYALRNTNTYTTIDEEIEIIKTYLRIQTMRYEDKFSYQLNVDPEIGHLKIPAMILQPLIENCIVHGLEEKSGKGMITIQINKINDQELQFQIADNGIGMSQKQLLSMRELFQKKPDPSYLHSKHGLLNVLYRIYFSYPDSVIHLDSEKNKGTKIQFTISVNVI